MIDLNRFENTLNGYNIQLNDRQLEQLNTYAKILVEYNEKVNLTAITDPLGIENKHFLDSLLFANDERVVGKLADVGTGAGFPGIVAKIYKPEIDLTLIEPTGKRCTFLQYALDTLNLKGNVVKERAEEAARKKYREQFDTVTARAVAQLNILNEYCIPLTKVGGHFIAMKSNIDAELQTAQISAKKLGGEYLQTKDFILPDDSKRVLVVYKKIENTNKVYPRNGGKINKSPL